MTEKKLYEKPTIEVVEVNIKSQLLQSSVASGDVNATMDDTWTQEYW